MNRYYEPINPEQNYDRDIFVPEFSKFSDLEEYIQGIIKTPNDPTLLSDLGGLLHSNPRFYENIAHPASVARLEADRAYSHGIEAMSHYVKKNLDDFFDLVDEEKILSLVTNVLLYKTGNTSSHDDFVEIANKLREINQASGDISKIKQYLANEIKGTPEWLQEAFGSLMNRQDYVSALFQEFASYAQMKFQEEIQIDKRINRSRLETIFRHSLDKAWEMHDEEPDKGKKNDIWEGDIRHYYITLAKIAYPQEKKDYKYDKDSDKEDREAERREIGMRN